MQATTKDEAIVPRTRGQQRFEKLETAIVPNMESATVKIVWKWWRITQSQYHDREVSEIDLGEIL